MRIYRLQLVMDHDRQHQADEPRVSLDLRSPAGLAAATAVVDQQGRGMARQARIPARHLDRCWVQVVDPDTGDVVHTHHLSEY